MAGGACKFEPVNATFSELQHNPALVMRPLRAGQTVVLTEQGKPLAEIRRRLPVVEVRPEELRACEVSDGEILAALNEARA